MMWFGDGFDGGWMNAGMSMMAVFWLGLLALIWLIVARLAGRREHGSDRPEDILKTRLARARSSSRTTSDHGSSCAPETWPGRHPKARPRDRMASG